jgi:hypothetical protein
MYHEKSIIPISFLIGAFIALVVGVLYERTNYQKDTYECTLLCPMNSHSIRFEEVCYCEIKRHE